MQMAKFSFLFLQYFGIWRPVHWFGRKAWLYNCYGSVMLTIFYSTILSQLLALITYLTDVQKFINEGLITLAILIACIKCTNILMNRNELVALNEWLQKSPCSPEDQQEIVIQNEFNKSIDWIASTYGIMVSVGVFFVKVHSVSVDIPNHQLPFPALLFYKIDSNSLYWITFIAQHLTDIIAGAIVVADNSLIAACILQACAQMKFLQHRMEVLCLKAREKCGNNFNNEKEAIKKCVEHYINIADFAESTNKIFTYTIFLQYSISIIIICACMYNLAAVLSVMSSAFISVTMILTCVLMQMFIFCFYGTIITDESANIASNFYSLDWTALSISSQKYLILMMIQTERPIVFTSGHVVVLSLQSFAALCKLSYSAFNILIQKK